MGSELYMQNKTKTFNKRCHLLANYLGISGFSKRILDKTFFFLILCVLPSQFDFYSVGLHITGPCIRSHRLESKGEWGPKWKSSWREKGLTWVKQPWPPTWMLLKDATLSWWNKSQVSQELQTGNSWKIQNKKSLKPWLPI